MSISRAAGSLSVAIEHSYRSSFDLKLLKAISKRRRNSTCAPPTPFGDTGSMFRLCECEHRALHPHKLASYDPRCEFGSERVEAEGRACRGRRAGSSPDGRRGEAHAVEGVREPLRAVHVGLHL